MFQTNRKVSKWFNITIENPFKTWWKAKKFFRIPDIRIELFYDFHKNNRYEGKILELECFDLQWKDKFNSPRHEINPHISILLFGIFGIRIEPKIFYRDEFNKKQDGDSEYWEYLLDYLYYGKSLLNYSTWTTDSKLYKERIYGKAEDGSTDTFKPLRWVVPCVAMSLNKKGIKELKKELNDKRLNS